MSLTFSKPPVVEFFSNKVGLDYPLSSHFTFGALTKTENRKLMDKNREEGKKYLSTLSKFCTTVLEPIWDLMGPTTITSCFRCVALNSAVGGAKNSQHTVAEAADTQYFGVTLSQAFNIIAFSSIPYSQCILEFGQWIHVGMIDETKYPGKRGQKLIATRQNGKVIYTLITKPI